MGYAATWSTFSASAPETKNETLQARRLKISREVLQEACTHQVFSLCFTLAVWLRTPTSQSSELCTRLVEASRLVIIIVLDSLCKLFGQPQCTTENELRHQVLWEMKALEIYVGQPMRWGDGNKHDQDVHDSESRAQRTELAKWDQNEGYHAGSGHVTKLYTVSDDIKRVVFNMHLYVSLSFLLSSLSLFLVEARGKPGQACPKHSRLPFQPVQEAPKAR